MVYRGGLKPLEFAWFSAFCPGFDFSILDAATLRLSVMMCNKMLLAVLAAGVLTISAWVERGLGAPTVFFALDNNELSVSPHPNSDAKFNEFIATLTSYDVDPIDGINNGPPTFGFNPTLHFNAIGTTAVANGTAAQSAPGFQIGTKALVEADAIPDPEHPELPPPGPQVDSVFNFDHHITAFGLYVIQGGDRGIDNATVNNNPTTFRLKDLDTNSSVDVPVQIGPGWGFFNIFFLGLVDNVPFNQVSIIESIDKNDGMLYDNVVAGNVPEPASVVLMMLGAVFCWASRFRRR
jgi:hypothetical protein